MRAIKPATGVKGILIRVGDRHVFRVYEQGHINKFIDYDILHHDLEVQILEDDAIFYHSEFGNYLDYPPIDMDK
jgi:hypothetical protein